MLLKEIICLLEASLVYGEQYLNKEIKKAFAADLMSDVLRLNRRHDSHHRYGQSSGSPHG